jgi:cell division septation protein DedD
MFVRVLFLLLLAANLGAASWLVFAPSTQATQSPASDPGVPKLVLLSERDRGDDASAELAAPPESRADQRNDECHSIGTFPTQADVRAAINVLTPLTRRIQFREAHATQARGYWVYLPALQTREQALAAARQLSGKGVRDYYVVTAGDQQNTISLGLFRDQANAERRRAEIAALGFTPQSIARTEELPVYWLDYAIDRAHPLDWRTKLGAGSAALREQAIGCF